MFCQRLFLFFSKKFHTWYMHGITCYCPTGLLPHFYWMKWLKHSQLEGCQCPLGLLPHFYTCRNFLYNIPAKMRVNALSGCYLISTAEMRYLSYYKEYPCQCPLGLLPHFYYNKSFKFVVYRYDVSMPSRAVTSFLQYPFKNLGFMRLPEAVFAGIYQNILTTAVFRAC